MGGVLPFQAVDQLALPRIQELVSGWVGKWRREGRWIAMLNPTRSDTSLGSFKICVRTGRWREYATGDHGRGAISLMAYLFGISQGEACRELGRRFGVLSEGEAPPPRRIEWTDEQLDRMRDDQRRAERIEGARKSRLARRIWRDAIPAAGTEVERYLRGRGITIRVPPSLRLGFWAHPDLAKDDLHPVMVAPLQRHDGEFGGVHRTYLARGGAGKLARPKGHKGKWRTKLMLGQAWGSSIRLTPWAPYLVLCEGIETALSVLQLAGDRWAVWAAGSSGNYGQVALPDGTRRLVIAADGDPAGLAEARKAATSAEAIGVRSLVVPAPDGTDWNDVLQEDAELAEMLGGHLRGLIE